MLSAKVATSKIIKASRLLLAYELTCRVHYHDDGRTRRSKPENLGTSEISRLNPRFSSNSEISTSQQES
jgi:hypothetical protein